MLTKPISHEVYGILLPYPGYWPEVHEIHYEPTAEEMGKQPYFIRKDSLYWTALAAKMIRPGELQLVEADLGEGVKRRIPLKQILAMENSWYEATGHAHYRRNFVQPYKMTHLIVEKNGEPLAHYFASANFQYGFRLEDIVFGEQALRQAPHEPQHIGTLSMTYHTDAALCESAPFSQADARAKRSPTPTLRMQLLDLGILGPASDVIALRKLADSIDAFLKLPESERKSGDIVV